MVIEGERIGSEILTKLKSERKPEKFFACFLVGGNPESARFIRQKEKVAADLGVDFRSYRYPETIRQDELRSELNKIVGGKRCGGAIVQLPLPQHIDAQYVMNVIPHKKDVDVLGERALGAFYTKRNLVFPPAVGVIKEILTRRRCEIASARIAVVGMGPLIGKPALVWAIGKAREIYGFDKGSNLANLKEADVVVLGAGQPHLVNGSMLDKKAVVIDFGCRVDGGKIFGDFDPSGAGEEISYTPTPKGTGPILVAKLFENFFTLAKV